MTWREALIKGRETVRDAIAAIDGGTHQIALIVGENDQLLGTITDGDVRRAILRGVSLDSPSTDIMSRAPVTAFAGASRNSLLSIMRSKKVNQLPLIDPDGRVVGIETLGQLINSEVDENIVVLMAGGLGSRLRPLTNDTPKPLLEVGNKPLLETILEQLLSHGFQRIYVAVNYLADAVKEHLGDGASWNAEIKYIEEEERMGTAGALGLLPDKPTAPFLVMNGDLLTNVNFRHLLSYHEEQRCEATLCVHEYVSQLSYGVVDVEDNRVAKIREKPSQRHFINAGIYVMEPEILRLVPEGEYCDMTTLIERIVAEGGQTAVFPIREFWMDIGRHDDYAAAAQRYDELFK